MKILNVSTTKGTRQGNMFCIEFQTENAITTHQTVSLSYEDEVHYFEVCEVYTNTYSKILRGKAMEVGYYNLFSKNGSFDIRKLLDKELCVVADVKELEDLAQQQCYC